MTNRRTLFHAVAMALGLASTGATKAKTSRIRLGDIEHEYDPTICNVGRGVPIQWEQLDHLDAAEVHASGYRPFVLPGTEISNFPVLGNDGQPTGDIWFGWVRESNGKHLIAAVEVGSCPKTPAEAAKTGWKLWRAPGTGQSAFPIHRADGKPTNTSFVSFYRGPVRRNFEVAM